MIHLEVVVKYMIMVLSNPHFQQRFDALTDAERERFGTDHLALTEELLASGELVVSEGLGDPALAKRVSVGDDAVSTVDGPFAEAKEHLAGFYLVDCASQERAVEIAARIPDAVWGLVEVRPVLDMSTLDV